MYYIEIKTLYNTLKLIVDDMNDPQLLEILEQPYVVDVKVKTKEDLEKERDEALWHCVGTAYYMQVAKEKDAIIRKLKK